MTERQELLLKMYDQMFNDINRHILVVWQSAGVLVSAFAIFALAEKQIIPLDIASALIALISSWFLTHLYDASYWYNRNLVIIANIERQFLLDSDLKDIHYYFGKHRPKASMLTHLRIQKYFGIGILIIVMLFHFSTRVYPYMKHGTIFDPQKTIPYIVIIISYFVVGKIKAHRERSYEEFMSNSPGKTINTTNVTYGIGHGFDS